ncbi:MAG: hypothetical protein NT177_05930 [Chloroflexi bacterium]|jgi:hypothetical protein|nr:hypothetical protein [Chloroflexota bacterium]
MKINRLLVYLLMAVALALPVVTGCIGQPPIERAVLSTAVSKAGEPLLAADNFTPDINTIYCSVKLNAPSAKSTVRADWYLVKSDEAGLTDTMIGSGSVAAETPFVVCSFARAETPLPRGEYQVKLYFDNKFVQAVPFQVQGEAAASAATLSEAALSSGIDTLTGKPIGSASIFPSDTTGIYCSVKVSGAGFGDQIKARWVYAGGELKGFEGKTIGEDSTKVEGREYVSFPIGRAEGKNFPTGDYNVNVYVGDKGQVSLDFKVVAPVAVPALYVGEASVYAFKDAEQKEVNLTSRFTADTPEIFFRAKIYNAPPGTQMSVQWIIVKSDEAAVDNYQVAEDKNVIDGTLVIAAKMAAGKEKLYKGDYAVKLLLNGEEKVTIPFKVQ